MCATMGPNREMLPVRTDYPDSGDASIRSEHTQAPAGTAREYPKTVSQSEEQTP